MGVSISLVGVFHVVEEGLSLADNSNCGWSWLACCGQYCVPVLVGAILGGVLCGGVLLSCWSLLCHGPKLTLSLPSFEGRLIRGEGELEWGLLILILILLYLWKVRGRRKSIIQKTSFSWKCCTASNWCICQGQHPGCLLTCGGEEVGMIFSRPLRRTYYVNSSPVCKSRWSWLAWTSSSCLLLDMHDSHLLVMMR